jgi:ribulose-phosphate 3-epimerase
MQSLIDPAAQAAFRQRLYRYRFLLIYIFIGGASLWIEILLLRGLHYLGLPFLAAMFLGLATGIIFAFWLNARFNFKVPIAKRRRAFAYFVLISAGSAVVNFIFKQQLLTWGWSYEGSRFVVSGLLFSVAYVFHRRYSFADRKQVGVAVYANGIEDIRGIRGKIGDFPDFIHVDLIDATYAPTSADVRSYRLETIRAYWPKRAIHVHLMTRQPLRWLPDVLPYADMVIVHHEIDDSLDEVLGAIHAAGRTAGLALQLSTPLVAAQPWLDRIALLMLLTIARPGSSGQHFQHEAALARIEEINQWSQRRTFSLCVDGGVNEKNIHLLNVELIVSGSSVLGAADPSRQIMRLQTSSNYEAT